MSAHHFPGWRLPAGAAVARGGDESSSAVGALIPAGASGATDPAGAALRGSGVAPAGTAPLPDELEELLEAGHVVEIGEAFLDWALGRGVQVVDITPPRCAGCGAPVPRWPRGWLVTAEGREFCPGCRANVAELGPA